MQKAVDFWHAKGFPITDKENEIGEAIKSNDRILLEAETGSGKTRIAPPIFLKELIKDNPKARIVVTQPRKIATEDAWDYVGEKVGKEFIGFHHKNKTRNINAPILYTVEKSLLIERLADPLLSNYDAVVLDEVHESSIDMYMLMPLLKITQALRAKSGRPLKLIMTSATLDSDKMLKYFDGAKHIEVDGRTFPVSEDFLKDKLYEQNDKIDIAKILDAAVSTSEQILKDSNSPGDILIFMPGREEIAKTIELLNQKISDTNVEFVQLLGGEDTTSDYKKETGKRKIIVATSVAETSITIDSVRNVIDSGLLRTNVFNEETGMTELITREHTQANAKQRAGRAGRTANGKVFYLFTREQFEARDKFLQPEILRANLSSQVLQMKTLENIPDIYEFDFLDRPPKEKIDRAIASLKILGALDSNGNLTDLGREMAEIEADPHYARMIVEARKRGVEDAVGLLIGLMTNRRSIYDLREQKRRNFMEKYGKFVIPRSDFLTQLNIWNEYVENNKGKEMRQAWSEANGINSYAFYTAANQRNDLLSKRIPQNQIDLSAEAQKAIEISIASGLMDSKLIKDDYGTYKLAYGNKGGIILGNTSALFSTKPPEVLSGNIHFSEKAKMTFANFNMKINEQLLREALPYLYAELTEKKPLPPSPKREFNKPQNKVREVPAVPIVRDIPIPPSPIYRQRIRQRSLTLKDILLYIPRQIAYGLKSISAAIGNAIKYFKSWF